MRVLLRYLKDRNELELKLILGVGIREMKSRGKVNVDMRSWKLKLRYCIGIEL